MEIRNLNDYDDDDDDDNDGIRLIFRMLLYVMIQGKPFLSTSLILRWRDDDDDVETGNGILKKDTFFRHDIVWITKHK